MVALADDKGAGLCYNGATVEMDMQSSHKEEENDRQDFERT